MPFLELLDFKDYGYVEDCVTESVKPQMMDQRAAPPELLNDLVCFCEDLCTEDGVFAHNEQSCNVTAVSFDFTDKHTLKRRSSGQTQHI